MTARTVALKQERKAQIPSAYAKRAEMLAAVSAVDGVALDRRAAYRRLLAMDAEGRRASAATVRQRTALAGQARHAAALRAIDPALKMLANVYDLLEYLKDGRLQHFTPDALAAFASAGLKEAGTELEQALYDLGALTVEDSTCGWFVEEFTATPGAAR